MPAGQGTPIRHRVTVKLGGHTVADLRSEAERRGLDPGRPEVRAMLSLGQPDVHWHAIVTFEIGAAGATPVAVELRSTTGQAVSRKAWDSVRVAEVISEARSSAEWLAPATGRVAPAEIEAPAPTGQRGRPASYSAEFYGRVARIYRAAVAAGERPLRAVARAFESEYPGIADSGDYRVKSWIASCRSKGLIPTKVEAENRK